MRALFLVVVVGLSLGVAHAEKVRTNQSTKLLARPGERSKVLMSVPSGQNMTLVEKTGRWLKVRVKGRTGYVPRSKVDVADDDEIARNTRRRPFVDGRGTRRGFGGASGAPDDRVGADAVGDGRDASEPDDDRDDDRDDEADRPAPRASRPASKPSPRKVEDDEDEEDDAPPAAKPAAKPPARPAPKPAPPRRGGEGDDEEEGDDDEEDDDAPAGRGDEGGSSSGDDDEAPSASAPGGGRRTARVRTKVAAYARPGASNDDDEEFFALPGDVLFPMETRDGWTEVETEEGDLGWVRTDDLELDAGGGAGGRRVLDVRARMGFTFIQQGMRTAGSSVVNVPDNYNIGTSAVALSLGGGVLVPRGRKLLLGGELTYDLAKTVLGGVTYDPDGPASMPAVNIGITLHNVNVRLLGGIRIGDNGMTLLARLGYRYQAYLIGDVENFAANPARLPSEVVSAPTLGAALAMPRLTDKLGLKVSLDSILFAGSVTQTEGLEDGATPSVFALSLGAAVTYKLGASFDLMASYDLGYMGINFGAPLASSMRGHMGTQVRRVDIFHTVTAGIVRPF